MRRPSHLKNLVLWLAVVIAVITTAQAQTDPLPSWELVDYRTALLELP